MIKWPDRNDRKRQWIITIPYKRFYSVKDAARILGVGTSDVYSRIKRGTLGGVQVEGVAKVRHRAIVAYIQKRKKAEGPVGPHSHIVEVVPVLPRFTHDSKDRMPKADTKVLSLLETEFDHLKQ